jgi:hypothetical protein
MQFTTNEVLTFKLNNGDEIVTKVISGPDEYGYLTVSEPVSVVTTSTGVGMIPTIMTAEMNAENKLNTNSISMFTPTNDNIKLKYLEATTGIKVPTKKLIVG